MDKTYADTVRLLLAVAPDVFANDIFAMKGGTAINLFVRDMPRLSVDIDVVIPPVADAARRSAASHQPGAGRHRHARCTTGRADTPGSRQGPGDTKLIVENDASQVKIEVNVVFRGSVLPVERRR